MAVDIPIDAIYRFARRRIRDPWLAEDVAQTACLYALTHRPARPWQYVFDALATELGLGGSRIVRGAWPIEHPEWIASHYPTDAELAERWLDEESEDQADEWRKLPAAERDSRAAEAARLVGTWWERF